MVERQLKRRGISDERVLEAMGSVARESFVLDEDRRRAYDDGALPIGHEQTISQPWIVAAICEALELTGDETVLEIGTGSGYSAAVLARLAAAVITIERVPELAATARELLAGTENVEVLEGDGSAGLPERAPFGGIAVHAAAPAPPPSLLAQLDTGGRLVVPISSGRADMLTVFHRVDAGEGDDASYEQRTIGPTRFVRLIGTEGFS
jgi:protein-L-isoaspartate(D-aspartate) O-methyltransferase